MNSVRNDSGRWVTAVGAPGSIERMKVEYPMLLERINSLYWQSFDEPGRAVDEAIMMIREAGITSKLETKSMLLASAYADENDRYGSVTQMVLRCL